MGSRSYFPILPPLQLYPPSSIPHAYALYTLRVVPLIGYVSFRPSGIESSYAQGIEKEKGITQAVGELQMNVKEDRGSLAHQQPL